MSFDCTYESARVLQSLKAGFSLLSFFLFLGFWFGVGAGRAEAAAQVILTWEANGQAAAGYEGRILAVKGSMITAGASVTRNGRLFDGTATEFEWTVDGAVIKTGRGASEITFPVTKRDREDYLVKVVVRAGGDEARASVTIPVVKPVLVVDHGYPENVIRAGTEAKFEAKPYFFPSFEVVMAALRWKVNDAPSQDARGGMRVRVNVGYPETAFQRTLRLLLSASGAFGNVQTNTTFTIF